MNLDKELNKMLLENNLVGSKKCNSEEFRGEKANLPDNVFFKPDGNGGEGTYIKLDTDSINWDKVIRYTLLKQLEQQRKTKSYMLFFVILTVISIIGTLISMAVLSSL